MCVCGGGGDRRVYEDVGRLKRVKEGFGGLGREVGAPAQAQNRPPPDRGTHWPAPPCAPSHPVGSIRSARAGLGGGGLSGDFGRLGWCNDLIHSHLYPSTSIFVDI